MKKILFFAIAALFAWTASAQDDNYRTTAPTRDRDYRTTTTTRDGEYRNATTRDGEYRNATARDGEYRNAATTRDGNYRNAETTRNYRSAVGPRVNFYTNTGDASVGIGVYYRYSFDSHWRIEPSIYVLTEKDSSVDLNFDAHYVFHVAQWWSVYPQVGIVANDIKDWAVGMSVGAGFDFNIARRWNLSAGLKYEPMFDSDRKNPLVVYVGAAYRF